MATREERMAAASTGYEDIDEELAREFFADAQELFGAYKLEFSWYIDRGVFKYSDWDCDLRDTGHMWYEHDPLGMTFGIADLRQAVGKEQHAYDGDEDGSGLITRHHLLRSLNEWKSAIEAMSLEIESELLSLSERFDLTPDDMALIEGE